MRKILITSIVVFLIACIVVTIIPKQSIKNGATNLFSSVKKTVAKINFPQITKKQTTKKSKIMTKKQSAVKSQPAKKQTTPAKSKQTKKLEAQVAELTQRLQSLESQKQTKQREIKEYKSRSKTKFINPEDYHANLQQPVRTLAGPRLISGPMFGRMWGGMYYGGSYYQPWQTKFTYPNNYRSGACMRISSRSLRKRH